MSLKKRNAMADRERLATLAVTESAARRVFERRNDRAYYLTALIWAVLAALPSILIGRPLPYMVGSTASYNIYSRVDYRWQDDSAETQALKNVESAFWRIYREEPLSLWAAETHGPIDQFLVRAAVSDNIDELVQAAKDMNIPATRDQIGVLMRGATFAKNDPYHYLVNPIKEILDNEVYPQGVLEPERFEAERGRTIQVVREGSSSTAMVGGERGPVTATQLSKTLDQRFRVKLSSWFGEEFKIALRDVILSRLKPNLVYDEAASKASLEERREELIEQVQNIKKNDLLVSRGETLLLDKVAKLREEDRVWRESQGWRLPFTRFIGNLLLFVAISVSMVIYFRTAEGGRVGSSRRFYFTAVLCLLVVLVGYWLIYMGFPGTMLPIGLVVGIAVMGINKIASVFLVAISSLCGLILFEGRPDLMIGHLAAGLFYISTATLCRQRVSLLGISLLSGLIGAVAFIAWNFARGDLQNFFTILRSPTFDEGSGPLIAALGLVANWVMCGLFILALLPLIEWFFGVTSRIRLQDLASQEHPLLKRLILEAPGTFHHSTIVSTLAETAADAIGADGLKARIGGLFHDIGKLLKPEYFSENEAGVSRHESLNPNMSALLIINHVRDGAEMAKSFGLPSLVVDMIQQHHGDSLMKFFYHKATQQASPGAVVAREPFLYPGPKPQSPEAGVLMIADSVEAAVRSLDNPSPQHLRTLLARLIRDRLIEGQFEESGLSMAQLAKVEDVIFRMLASMYHTRVKYPGQTEEKQGRKR